MALPAISASFWSDSATHDHRVDNLVEKKEQVFQFQARLWREAAASDSEALCSRAEADMAILDRLVAQVCGP